MIETRVTIVDETKRVRDAAARDALKNIQHAAGALRLTAARSIRKRRGPSAPGTPPHTHAEGRPGLRKAIAYAVEQGKLSAVIGPLASHVGESGAAHEFGGEFRGEQYEARPFMRPALDKHLDRFAPDWAGTIGE